MTLSEKIGKVIVQLRKERGISQDVFVNKIIGRDKMSVRYLSDIENGLRNISLSVLQVISDGFGMKMSELTKLAEEYKEPDEKAKSTKKNTKPKTTKEDEHID